MTLCPRPGCGRQLWDGWCTDHGTMVDSLPYSGPVESPRPRRRRDLAARAGSAWTAAELRFVHANKDRLSIAQLAQQLHRSPKGLMNLLSKKGWRKRRVRQQETTHPAEVSRRPRSRWSPEEDEALLASLGLGKANAHMISHRMGQAARIRLRRLGEGSLRTADGMLSMAAVAVEYSTPISRVRRLVRTGRLPATRSTSGQLRIDPGDCEAVRAQLTAPKRTWRASPPDVGDYAQRYGLRWKWDRKTRRARRVPNGEGG